MAWEVVPNLMVVSAMADMAMTGQNEFDATYGEEVVREVQAVNCSSRMMHCMKQET